MLRLEYLRKELNLSQEEFAKKVNMTQQRISAYEKGKREPDIETIKQLANFFDCTIDYLLGKSYYRNYEEFDKVDKFVLNYALTQTKEEAILIANTLNYINTHKDEDVNIIIEKAIKNLPIQQKENLRIVISHLHYRYHGKLPQKTNTTYDNEILKYYNQLNELGKEKALENMKDLTEIPKYTEIIEKTNKKIQGL